MSATNCTSRELATISPKHATSTPTRSVPEMLLELAYRLHATRAVKFRPCPANAAQALPRGE